MLSETGLSKDIPIYMFFTLYIYPSLKRICIIERVVSVVFIECRGVCLDLLQNNTRTNKHYIQCSQTHLAET